MAIKTYSFCSKSIPDVGKSDRVKYTCGRIVLRFRLKYNLDVEMLVIALANVVDMTDFGTVLDK